VQNIYLLRAQQFISDGEIGSGSRRRVHQKRLVFVETTRYGTVSVPRAGGVAALILPRPRLRLSFINAPNSAAGSFGTNFS
jgi:hypothetical protein